MFDDNTIKIFDKRDPQANERNRGLVNFFLDLFVPNARPRTHITIDWLFLEHDIRQLLPERKFGEILLFSRNLDCKNPPDNIYGILGLVEDAGLPVIGYSRTVQQVYLDAIRASPRSMRAMYLRDGNSRHEKEEKTLGLYRHLGKSTHLEDRMNGLDLFLRAVDKIEILDYSSTSGHPLDTFISAMVFEPATSPGEAGRC